MNMNLETISEKGIAPKINNFYKKSIEDQLKSFKEHDSDSKLYTFANCYEKFDVQQYLNFNLPKSVVKNLTKLRLSAHTLLIEKGRYTRPKTPRNQRICTECHKIEDEKHFILFCKKIDNLRTTLFSKINLNNNFDESQSEETSSIFKKLMNPRNVDEIKHICNFIQSSFSICIWITMFRYFILLFMSLYMYVIFFADLIS